MTCYLFTISDDPRVIDKDATPTPGAGIAGTVRDVADVLHPQITFNGTLSGYNYMYIAEFGRYYYLDPPTYPRTGLTVYTGSVDVLHSFSTGIKLLPGIPARSASAPDWYMHDSKQPLRAYRTIYTAEGTEMAYDANYVLITAG